MAKRDKFASLDTYLVLDPYIQTLNANDRWLFFVLVCNPDISMIGVYEVGLPTLELYTGLGRDAMEVSLNQFAAAGKIHYVDGWVIVKNHIKNNPIRGEKLLLGAHKRLEDLPWFIRDRLVKSDDTLYIPYLDHTNSLFIGYPDSMDTLSQNENVTQPIPYTYPMDTPGTPSPALTPSQALTQTRAPGPYRHGDRSGRGKRGAPGSQVFDVTAEAQRIERERAAERGGAA